MNAILELLGQVTGWGNMVRPIIGYNEVRQFTGPDETVFLCGVSICGVGPEIKVRGEGKTLGAAMLDCAVKVVNYHKQREEWHRKRRIAAERAIVQAGLGEQG